MTRVDASLGEAARVLTAFPRRIDKDPNALGSNRKDLLSRVAHLSGLPVADVPAALVAALGGVDRAAAEMLRQRLAALGLGGDATGTSGRGSLRCSGGSSYAD